MKLYIFLDIITILFPLFLSWDKKVRFYKQFKSLFIAMATVGLVFIGWDMYFTEWGVWGFNDAHLLGISWFNLPIEEILFFVVVPYACVFLHDVISHYWPIRSGNQFARILTIGWGLLSIIIFVFSLDRLYTASAFGLSGLVALILLFKSHQYLAQIWRSYLIIVIPFLIINGALTGTFTDEPVVWYNDLETLNFRIITIPIEDLFYNFSLILSIILIRDYFNQKA